MHWEDFGRVAASSWLPHVHVHTGETDGTLTVVHVLVSTAIAGVTQARHTFKDI